MNYTFVEDLKTNRQYKPQLRKLIETNIFKLTLDNWMLKGHDNPDYKYYGLANSKDELLVSVGLMITTLFFNNKKYSAIQIGNVFFRRDIQHSLLDKANLYDELLKGIIKKFFATIDVIYTCQEEEMEGLLAKFDLNNVNEIQYCLNVENLVRTKTIFHQLFMENPNHYQELWLSIKHSLSLFRKTFDVKQNVVLKMYNILKYYSKYIYRIDELDTIVILDFKKNGEICSLIDVFSKNNIDLNKILQAILPPQVKVVEFGFDPTSYLTQVYEKPKPVIKNGYLGSSKIFVKPNTFSFDSNKFCFPILSRHK